jgi:hypothetical protein
VVVGAAGEEVMIELAGSLAQPKGNVTGLTRVFVSTLKGKIVSSCLLATVPNLMRGGSPYAFIENRRDTQPLQATGSRSRDAPRARRFSAMTCARVTCGRFAAAGSAFSLGISLPCPA